MKDTISKLMNVLKTVKGGEKQVLSARILELEKSEANLKETLSNEIINSTELELKVDDLEKRLKVSQQESESGGKSKESEVGIETKTKGAHRQPWRKAVPGARKAKGPGSRARKLEGDTGPY